MAESNFLENKPSTLRVPVIMITFTISLLLFFSIYLFLYTDLLNFFKQENMFVTAPEIYYCDQSVWNTSGNSKEIIGQYYGQWGVDEANAVPHSLAITSYTGNTITGYYAWGDSAVGDAAGDCVAIEGNVQDDIISVYIPSGDVMVDYTVNTDDTGSIFLTGAYSFGDNRFYGTFVKP